MSEILKYRDARNKFFTLLEKQGSAEREWQSLFVEHPFILTECLALGIDSEKLIPCKPGRSEADFYFYPEAKDPISPYGVIEVKRPDTNILRVARKNVLCLSADATTAVAQAKQYSEKLKTNFAKNNSELLVIGNPLQMFVIAGLKGEIARKVTTDLLKIQYSKLLPPECMLVPFDVLYDSLNSRIPPQIYVLVPSYPEISVRSKFLETPQMYLVACSECGFEIFVPFKPIGNRPILCRDCYRKRRQF